MSPGQKSDLENVDPEISVEEPLEDLDRLEKLYKMIESQNNAILLLTGKMAEMTTKQGALEEHQDQSDTAIIEVAKKVGSGGGGGAGNLLAQVLPYLRESRGSGPLEKIAMKSFLENMAFSTLTTRRIARKQFGDEYADMVKEMEAELAGGKSDGS